MFTFYGLAIAIAGWFQLNAQLSERKAFLIVYNTYVASRSVMLEGSYLLSNIKALYISKFTCTSKIMVIVEENVYSHYTSSYVHVFLQKCMQEVALSVHVCCLILFDINTFQAFVIYNHVYQLYIVLKYKVLQLKLHIELGA